MTPATRRSATPERATRASASETAVASVWVRGAVAAATSTAIVLAPIIVVVLAIWAADAHSGSSAADATRVGLAVWLVAQRVPLDVSGGQFALAPLGLTVLELWALARVTAFVAAGSRCRSLGDVAPAVAAVVVPYTVVLVAVALATRGGAQPASVAGAVGSGLVIGGTTCAVGALIGAGRLRELWQSVPDRVRLPLTAGAAGLGSLVAVALLVTLLSVLVHGSQFAAALSARAAGGLTDQISLVLLTVLLLPNAVVYALAYLTGPGFTIGAGTHVSVVASSALPLPGVPLLTARPGGPAPGWVLALLVLALAAASTVTGWMIARSSPANLLAAVRDGALAAAVAGVGAAVVVALAGGPAGPGALAVVGGSPWLVGLAVAAETALVTMVVVTARVWVDVGRALTANS